MVGFIKRKVKSLTLGEKLKKIREEAGISLAEIATYTKIKQSYLEKIEAGDFEKLPFDVYVKGFLRSYAKYLDLDAEKVIQQFNKEIGVRENVKKYQKKGKNKLNFTVPNLTITPKMASIFFSVIIIIIGISYFYLEVDRFSKEPTLIIESPDSNKNIENSSIEIIGSTDFENKVTINNQPVYVDSEGKFKEIVGLQKGFNEIVIKAFNKFDKNSQKIVNVVANYDLEVLGTVAEEKKEPLLEEFIVEIENRNKANQIIIKVDEGEEQKNFLNPGIFLKIKFKEKLEISSGKANNTYVKINEGDFQAMDENETGFKKIVISKENIEEYLNKNKE